jgi:2-keto-4-pentenoate hydratase/2-oxohepta-3-ene-1,7-dioic acid hydratase in catechol pathway
MNLSGTQNVWHTGDAVKLPAWSLVQFTTSLHGTPRLGVYADDVVRSAPTALAGKTLLDVLADWNRWLPEIHSIVPASLDAVPDATIIAPLTYPKAVICVGANYYGHAEEMQTARPSPDGEPFFFLKPPATTIVGPGADIAIHVDGRSRVDWEVELGVVIGKRASMVEESRAAEYIAGYVVANDVSDRGLMRKPDAVFPVFEWDWVSHKAQDGFCPIGPGLVPAAVVGDPQNLRIVLDVNGVVKQDSSTADMVINVHRLIAHASRLMTLHPGDVILTGTPAGVGMPRNEYLHVGDTVTAGIEHVGVLRNHIVAK